MSALIKNKIVRTLLAPLSLCLVFLSLPEKAFSAPSYWDLMKTPTWKKSSMNITTNTESFITYADSGRIYDFGGGATVGLHWHLGGWRLGIETGTWFLVAQEDRPFDAPPSYTEENFLVMIPVYGAFGYSFDLGSWFSILPTIGVGTTLDFKQLDYRYNTSTFVWDKIDELEVRGSILVRLGLQFWFHFTDTFSMFFALDSSVAIEIGSWDPRQLAAPQIGFSWKI